MAETPENPELSDAASAEGPDLRPRARRAFGPVVLLGLASTGAAAYAGGKPFVSGRSGDLTTEQTAFLSPTGLDAATTSPLVAALALVALASWGVLLVARGWVRRAVALLAAAGAVGAFVATWVAGRELSDKVKQFLMAASGSDTASADLTGWFTVALVASALGALAGLLAVLWVKEWPEMGSRYDAPTAGGSTTDEPRTNLDIWKAIDEGQDPTA